MSPSPGDVSVVTVNWNGKSHLSTLLPPLLALGPGEVIVVDNGSADGSQGFLRKRYPQVRLLENGVNRGFAQPCNLGAETARGSHVAFINNDMRPEPDWLTAALGKLDTQTPCVASRILDWEGRRIDYNGSSLHYLGYGLQEDPGLPVEEAPRRDQVLFPCGGAMLVDRRVFLEVGGFDADFFALFEDVDLGWRLWLAGHRVVMAPDSVVRHRGHATLETQAPEKTRYLMHRNALLTIFKNYDEENFRKILPLALVLSVKRAVHFSGVRKESFYLWSETRHKLDEGDETARSQLLDSLNHLVAVDDVLQALPGWWRNAAGCRRFAGGATGRSWSCSETPCAGSWKTRSTSRRNWSCWKRWIWGRCWIWPPAPLRWNPCRDRYGRRSGHWRRS